MFDLAQYLENGTEKIIKGILRATLKNLQESAYMLKFSKATREAAKKRNAYESQGEHIPAFLIASITSSCNLHCAGCYARHNKACHDSAPISQLTDDEWLRIFTEARDIGISFILLAGGEPMLRRDVISAAGTVPEIMFPVFTNGTMFDDEYLQLFSKHRNLVPIFSIEGYRSKTDERRGDGVYEVLIAAMNEMDRRNLIYGASVTVTRDNLEEVTGEAFISDLHKRGCKAIIYVEYVPVDENSQNLAPSDEDRALFDERLQNMRGAFDDMLLVAFPGDEKKSGGCLAAGRGFFHINSHGGAEPCPFSPYSDANVKDGSLREAMKSGLFTALRNGEMLKGEHAGGCVLFEQREAVEKIMNEKGEKND